MSVNINGTTGIDLIQDGAVLLADLAAAVVATLVPTGTIIDFAGTTAPTGYLACPLVATNISRTTYSGLFAAIGTTWGVGDGSTTFGMPYFPEGYTTIQANANVSASSAGSVIAHNHVIDTYISGALGASGRPQEGATGSSDSASTLNFGGSANLAAGIKVLKCVKV